MNAKADQIYTAKSMIRSFLVAIMTAVLAGCAAASGTLPADRIGAHGQAHPFIKPIGFKYPALKDYFAWPVRGSVVSSFGAKAGRVINKGIDISAREGELVRAARAGKVVYCNPHMKGFGKTVILDHGDGFQTVYACNSDILVNVGDMVASNDPIAKVGRTGRAKEPMLHFEIRRDGKPQDPYYYVRH